MALIEVPLRLFAQFLAFLGQVAGLAGETLLSIGAGRIRPKLFLQQIAEIGFRSQLVVIVTGAFTGAVLTAQAFFQFDVLNMETAVGPVVALSVLAQQPQHPVQVQQRLLDLAVHHAEEVERDVELDQQRVDQHEIPEGQAARRHALGG